MDAQKMKNFADRVSPIRKSRKVSKDKVPEVGSPTNFKHLLHIGTDSHHVDISSVPTQWQDILDIAKYCQDLDMSSNSSNDSSETIKKETGDQSDKAEQMEEFESDIDLFADLERSLSDDYKKFLFG